LLCIKILLNSSIINNIECDWITRIKLIKEKFNRNSSSLESFILRYGEVEGQKQFDEKNEKCVVTLEKLIVKLGEDEGNKIWDEIRKSKRSVSLEIMTERYGEEEGLKRWNSYLEKWRVGIQKKKEKGDWKNGSTLERRIEIYGEEEGTRIWNENSIRMSKRNSLETYIEKHGEEKGKDEYEKYCKSMDKTSLKAFKKRYGEVDGKKRYEEYCKKVSYSNSVEGYIERYGPIVGPIKRQERFTQLIINGRFLKNYSKISQELFWSIYEQIDEFEKSKCYFAELNEEHVFYTYQNDIYVISVDFKFENKIIEFDGDFWHSSTKQKERDILRDCFLISKGYEVLRIPELDYKNDKKQIIEKCINFIKNEKTEYSK